MDSPTSGNPRKSVQTRDAGRGKRKRLPQWAGYCTLCREERDLRGTPDLPVSASTFDTSCFRPEAAAEGRLLVRCGGLRGSFLARNKPLKSEGTFTPNPGNGMLTSKS
ncbi:anaphase-promoting complex subunit 13 isoform X1 [Trachypithecus francoisi]|uniref:anaphase-promoting complex subunit 13 isoform X1 n=1 Tax=Trachypithecus francoisi TaxID=54180 RepID=UPI00141ADD2B|nr:anaphase-promoting complex subunit 13 isoform X1 [Trachypithecus francoisi]